jgi:DNA-binding GntR family transcriptional regulator
MPRSEKTLGLSAVADGPPPEGAEGVHARLREAILHGDLPIGAELSQVKLAAQLGVSRTPLREALRMLQAEGLIESERNRKVRVTSFAIDDLEQVYATRIVLEALGVRLTVPLLSEEQIVQLRGCLDEMADFEDRRDVIGWEEPHRRFHHQLVVHAGDQILRVIDQLADHARRYRLLYVTQRAHQWAQAISDHEHIFEACEQRDAALAADLLARHFAQTALSLIAAADPTHDPVPIRTALQTVLAFHGPGSRTGAARRGGRSSANPPVPHPRRAQT